MERESAIISLGRGHEAIVDLEDLPRLSKTRWFAQKHNETYYCVANANKKRGTKQTYMHHEVFGHPPQGKEIDHINGNGLDNRKKNLRFCSHRENCQARKKRMRNPGSRYKGVTWDKEKSKWRARIWQSDGTGKHLGYFVSEIDAAKAYDEAAKTMFGNFAQPNFPKNAEKADRLFPE